MNPSEELLLISAGYLVARPVERSPHMDASLVPARLRTASGCLAPIAPGTWAIDWARCDEAERVSAATRFGLPPSRLAELINWVTHRFDQDFLWPNVFLTLEGSREFCATFVPADSDAFILGLALSREDVDGLPWRTEPDPAVGEVGLRRILSQGFPPAEGGVRLGSDVLGAELDGTLHSYLCNGLEHAFSRELGAWPNEHGLFDDHALARRCAVYAGRDDVGAEPIPWRAWVLTEYPRQPPQAAPAR